jgi:cellulose 1,4-beta-cellobiosidase
MDIWEANSISAAVTPHVCSVVGQVRCEGTECGDGDERQQGVCDKDGCDFNSFRLGEQDFLGPGKTVDTTKPFTVVTQFFTADNTTTGDLVEIRRIYVQNGNVIQNSKVNIPGMDAFDSITDEFCASQKETFGDNNRFAQLGGLKVMGDSFQKGMVLVMSLWDDHEANMLWLDSSYPTDADASQPGIARGTCPTDSGKPGDVETNAGSTSVVFSAIKFGDIGSTFGSGSSSPTNPPVGSPTTGAPAPAQTKYGQCGGNDWT